MILVSLLCLKVPLGALWLKWRHAGPNLARERGAEAESGLEHGHRGSQFYARNIRFNNL
jgi:hypothetical protein